MDPAACGDRPNFLDFSFQKTVVVSSARALRERAPETRKMTNPADATQVDIAEKENAPSPAVKASPKPAANGDGSSKFVNVDGKVKHRRVVKADGVDAMTQADATVGAEQEHVNDYERCLLYTSPSPRDVEESRMPSSA